MRSWLLAHSMMGRDGIWRCWTIWDCWMIGASWRAAELSAELALLGLREGCIMMGYEVMTWRYGVPVGTYS